MKPLNLFTLSILLLSSTQVFAESFFLDSQKLKNCGYGNIELRKADNGDLAINIKDNQYCSSLRFYDRSSGKTIKNYEVNGSSYTLSKEQRSALSSDCQVGIDLSGRYGTDRYFITLGWWCELTHGAYQKEQSRPSSNKSYQLSQARNCKLMIDGNYSNKLVDDDYCQWAITRDDVITYEISHKGNCKLMINGLYSQKNVDNRFCQ